MEWFVYALYNATVNKIYIGQTGNLDKRLIEHNSKRGNHFTAKTSGEWKIVYKETVTSQKDALKREKELKSYQGRQFIKNLIYTHSPVAQR